jgi:hypothetical protein
MLKRLSLVLIMLLATAAVILAAEESVRAAPAGAPVTTMKGVLMENNGDWFLRSGKELYLLHFGNRAYLAGTGIPLADGKECVVEGNVLEDDIVVNKATVDGKSYAFRDKDGVSLWAGDRGDRWDMDDCPRFGPNRGGKGERGWDAPCCGRGSGQEQSYGPRGRGGMMW